MLERALPLRHQQVALDRGLTDDDRPQPRAAFRALATDLLRRLPILLRKLGEFIASGGPLS